MKRIHTKFWWTMVCFVTLSFHGAYAFQKSLASFDSVSPSNEENLVNYRHYGNGDMIAFNDSFNSNDRSLTVRKQVDSYQQSSERPRFALVIGNSNYRNIPALLNPGNDAFDMKTRLEKLGFKVTYLQDAEDRRKMTEAVRELGEDLKRRKDTVGLFFYAGHALQINGVNYLIPVNAVIKGEADVEYDTLNVNYLLQTMDLAKNDMNIVIMDACRNNPYARGFRSVADRGLAPMDSPTGSIIVFATAPGKTAADGTGRNGIFTKHLLKYINQPDLTIEQMLKQVRIGVIEETDGSQTPWETSSLRGDFCFAGCREKSLIENEALQKIETEMKSKLEEERQHLEKERARLEAQRIEIEAKKLEMKIKATEAQQRRDREALEKILQEQSSLTEQRVLIEKEKKRIEQQKEVLTDQSTSDSEKEYEIDRLKEERRKFESERAELERMRAETEAMRRKIEESRKFRDGHPNQSTEDQPATTTIPIGF